MSSSLLEVIGEGERQVGRRPAKKVQERCTRILECLAEGAELPVEAVVARTGVSPATIRRDLKRLERQGLIRRSHGAVAQMTRYLQSRRELTVVTNALNVAMDLSRRPQWKVHLTGGYLSGNWLALVGPKAIEFISAIFTDVFFFGANGVDVEHGVTDRHPEEAAVNQALAKQARRRVLLADHTKLGRTARHLVCPIDEVDVIITDSGASEELITPFQRLGVEVVRA